MKNLFRDVALGLLLCVVGVIALTGLIILLPGSFDAAISHHPFLAIGTCVLIVIGVRNFWRRAVAAHNTEVDKLGKS